MITRDRKYLGKEGEGARELLRGVIEEFEQGLPRLERLWRYRQGRGDILMRERPEGLANTRLAYGFPRYITQVSAGFLLSEPVVYRDETRPEGTEALKALYRKAGAEQADTELVTQQAGFGRGVTLFYEGEGGLKLCAPDPRSAFVVYDDTVEHRPLMGVLLSAERDARGRAAGGMAAVYLPGKTLCWRLRRGVPEGEPTREDNPFTRVPMVEYRNNEEERCDFEEVLGQIDAYDLLGSDRVNDRIQFADALLVLTGVAGVGTSEDIYDFRGGLKRLRQDRTLSLPDSDAKAEWLVKNPMEKDIDVLRKALAEDIHKFSMTPDFSDERFAGNLSGVAIRYKLFCLEQKIRLKERWFISGLRERARLMAHCMAQSGLPPLDAEQLTIRLQRRLPESDLERAQTLRTLAGLVPDSTLAEHAPINDQTTT